MVFVDVILHVCFLFSFFAWIGLLQESCGRLETGFVRPTVQEVGI